MMNVVVAGIVALAPIKVLIIDTGVYSDIKAYRPYLAMSQREPISDYQGHGTHITGLVLFGGLDHKGMPKERPCDDVQVDVCSLLPTTEGISKCFDLYNTFQYDIVNYSGGGKSFSAGEFNTIKDKTSSGTIFVVAAGNNGEVVKDHFFPAGYIYYGINNLIAVGNGFNNNDRVPSSNYGEGIKWMDGTNVLSYDSVGNPTYMSGTSQATGLYTHSIIMRLCEERNAISKGLFTYAGTCHW